MEAPANTNNSAAVNHPIFPYSDITTLVDNDRKIQITIS